MTRGGRKPVAWLCLSVLLFLQLAVAAYACTMSSAGNPANLVASTNGSEEPPCQGMDQQLPNLCEQHCLQAFQSVDTQPQPGVTAPALPLLVVVAHIDRYVPARRAIRRTDLSDAVDPPPLVRFGVLRI